MHERNVRSTLRFVNVISRWNRCTLVKFNTLRNANSEKITSLTYVSPLDQVDGHLASTGGTRGTIHFRRGWQRRTARTPEVRHRWQEGRRGECTFDSVWDGAIHLSSVYRSLAETEVYRARRSEHIRFARLIANKPLLRRPLPAPSLFSRYRVVSRSIASYATTSIASTF